MNELIPLEKVNAVELYTDEKKLQMLLNNIKKQSTNFIPDVSTPAGRAEITSWAYKVTQSKGVIDTALKAETDEWTRMKKIVDACRKKSRDFCDQLRDKIKEPLEAWKVEEARKTEELAKAATLKAQVQADELEAYVEYDLWKRERKVRETEKRLEAEEAERNRIRAAETAESERKANEERIRLEAEENATREAQEAIDEAERQAAESERLRIESEEKAKKDKKEAIENEQRLAREETDRVERKRLRLIEDEKREAQERAADVKNRRKINNAIVVALVSGGVGERIAKKVVTLVAGGKIPSISIRY